MASAAAAAPAFICIDLDSDDDDHKQPITKCVPQSKVKQEGYPAKGQEQQVAAPSTAVAGMAAVGDVQEAVTPPVVAATVDGASIGTGVDAVADPQQDSPSATRTAFVQQLLQPKQAAVNNTYSLGHTAVQAVSAAVSDDANQELHLPASFTLSDCDDDILTAGRQLTRLLRHLKAPKEQMVQLNMCINKLRSSYADESKLKDFWYDYDQLQFWVERRDDVEVKSGLEQLLGNARRGASF